MIFTGGEPALQLDSSLLNAMHAHDFECAIETNGTLPLPSALDWTCVSPKPNAPLHQTQGDELKFIFPQDTLTPEAFVELDFTHFFIQPMDVADTARMMQNRRAAVAYCLAHPQWRLSLQIHKLTDLR